MIESSREYAALAVLCCAVLPPQVFEGVQTRIVSHLLWTTKSFFVLRTMFTPGAPKKVRGRETK